MTAIPHAPLEPIELEALRQGHAEHERDCTPPCDWYGCFTVGRLLATLDAVEALSKRPLRTFDQRAADRLADEVAALVQRGKLDARSPLDALLDYRDSPSTPRADRLAQAEAAVEALRARLSAMACAEHGDAHGIFCTNCGKPFAGVAFQPRVSYAALRALLAQAEERFLASENLRRHLSDGVGRAGLIRSSLEDRLAQVEAQREALRRALDEYGRHKSACGIWAEPYRVIDPKKTCSCGLAAALAPEEPTA